MFFQWKIFPYVDNEIINTVLASYDIEILYYHFNNSHPILMSTQFQDVSCFEILEYIIKI